MRAGGESRMMLADHFGVIIIAVGVAVVVVLVIIVLVVIARCLYCNCVCRATGNCCMLLVCMHGS